MSAEREPRPRVHPVHLTWLLLRDAVKGFAAHDAPRHGAALAYYALFSIAPLLLLAISIAGLLYDEAAARAEVSTRLHEMLGPEGAVAVEGLLDRALPRGSGLVSTIVGVLTALFGASTVFVQLKGSIDRIWDVQPRAGNGLVAFVCGRALGIGMVVLTGTLLLASLALGTVVRVGGERLSEAVGLGPDALAFVWPLLSLGFVTAAFAAVFKFLPSVKVGWRDVLLGAFVTAVLFTLGRAVIGLYLARTGISSAYGAAGSLVAFMVWVYVSAQILLFGAEITQVWARRVGSRRGDRGRLPVPREKPGA
ncbi:MAG: YihY/virulence factor BrkB family protein [Myxococcota bacterium]